jgi:hypothetical protein
MNEGYGWSRLTLAAATTTMAVVAAGSVQDATAGRGTARRGGYARTWRPSARPARDERRPHVQPERAGPRQVLPGARPT